MKYLIIITVFLLAFSSCVEEKKHTKTQEPMFIGSWNVVDGKNIIHIKSDGQLIFDNYELQDKIVNYKFVEPDTIMWLESDPALIDKKDFVTIAHCEKDSLFLNLRIKGQYKVVKYYRIR